MDSPQRDAASAVVSACSATDYSSPAAVTTVSSHSAPCLFLFRHRPLGYLIFAGYSSGDEYPRELLAPQPDHHVHQGQKNNFGRVKLLLLHFLQARVVRPHADLSTVLLLPVLCYLLPEAEVVLPAVGS